MKSGSIFSLFLFLACVWFNGEARYLLVEVDAEETPMLEEKVAGKD